MYDTNYTTTMQDFKFTFKIWLCDSKILTVDLNQTILFIKDLIVWFWYAIPFEIYASQAIEMVLFWSNGS